MNYGALFSVPRWFALLRNKMRSILTVLGITIGIAAVICVVAIGNAGQAQVEAAAETILEIIFVWIEAGRPGRSMASGPVHTIRRRWFMADAVAIKNQVFTHQERFTEMSMVQSRSSMAIRIGTRPFRGVTPEYFDIKRWYLDQGAIFSQDDVDRAAGRLRDWANGAGTAFLASRTRLGK